MYSSSVSAFLYSESVLPCFVRRHGEHPLRVRGSEGHDPAVEPEGVQPRVRPSRAESSRARGRRHSMCTRVEIAAPIGHGHVARSIASSLVGLSSQPGASACLILVLLIYAMPFLQHPYSSPTPAAF